MDLKKSYGINKVLEAEGVWITIDATTKIKVARAGNQSYFNTLQDLVKKAGFSQFQISKGKIPNEVMADIVLQAIGKAVLVDWEGVEDEGKVVKYTNDAAYKILKEYPDFADDVMAIANNVSNFQDAVEEAEIKN